MTIGILLIVACGCATLDRPHLAVVALLALAAFIVI